MKNVLRGFFIACREQMCVCGNNAGNSLECQHEEYPKLNKSKETIAIMFGASTPPIRHVLTRVVCRVRGLTILILVGTLWRFGDGLFF